MYKTGFLQTPYRERQNQWEGERTLMLHGSFVYVIPLLRYLVKPMLTTIS